MFAGPVRQDSNGGVVQMRLGQLSFITRNHVVWISPEYVTAKFDRAAKFTCAASADLDSTRTGTPGVSSAVNC
jgi:hypothetical protein